MTDVTIPEEGRDPETPEDPKAEPETPEDPQTPDPSEVNITVNTEIVPEGPAE